MDLVAAAKEKQRRFVSVRARINEDCPLCLESMKGKPVCIQPCGHAMHLRCDRVLHKSRCSSRNCCPVCRRQLYELPILEKSIDMTDDIDILEGVLAHLESIAGADLWSELLRED